MIKYEDMQDADIFDIQTKLKFPLKINEYFSYINSILVKKEKIGKNFISEKIYDYVMGKIYDKIYPIDSYSKDNKIFQQSVLLSWTEPKHYIKKKQYVFGSFISDALKYFELLV